MRPLSPVRQPSFGKSRRVRFEVGNSITERFGLGADTVADRSYRLADYGRVYRFLKIRRATAQLSDYDFAPVDNLLRSN